MNDLDNIINIEKDNRCILIGGGESVNDFDFSKLPKDIVVIAVNRCFVDINIRYQIFTDPFFKEWAEQNPINGGRFLIGPKHINFYRMDYYYEFEKHIYEGFHSGYHALQVAQFLGFEEIYLIGYDYYEENLLHYYEGKYNTEITQNEKNAIKASFHKWIEDFNKIKWIPKIYNCNPKSKLKKFIYQEVN
jgi:hypothetical protein